MQQNLPKTALKNELQLNSLFLPIIIPRHVAPIEIGRILEQCIVILYRCGNMMNVSLLSYDILRDRAHAFEGLWICGFVDLWILVMGSARPRSFAETAGNKFCCAEDDSVQNPRH